MPMNHRIMVPRRGGHVFQDADARTYARAVEQADGAKLERLVEKAIDDFVIGCKADSIWSALGACCLMAGPRTLAGALVPLKGSAPTNSNFIGGDYNRKTGLKGNAVNKYLDSNYSSLTPPQDDVAAWAWSSDTDTTGPYFGAGLNVGGDTMFSRSANGLQYFIRCRNASGLTVNNAAPVTFVGVSRSSGAGYRYRMLGATNTETRASESPNTDDFAVFRTSGSAASSNHRIGAYGFGTDVDLEAVEDRITDYMTAIGAAIP